MQKSDFFEGISQTKVSIGPYNFNIPVFYRDMTGLNTYFLAPINKVKNILPSQRMAPYRVTPKQCVISISAFEYRDSDIGPYNEVSIGVPFILDKISPLFTGTLRKPPEIPMVYIHHLPVTTEIARLTGIESANFPKFLAEINFERSGEWIRCDVNAEGKNILTLSGRKINLRPSARQNICAITRQKNRLLRLEFNLSECEAGISKNQSDVRLELGDHPIGLELKELNIGRAINYQYNPECQALLTPVCESYAI